MYEYIRVSTNKLTYTSIDNTTQLCSVKIKRTRIGGFLHTAAVIAGIGSGSVCEHIVNRAEQFVHSLQHVKLAALQTIQSTMYDSGCTKRIENTLIKNTVARIASRRTCT